MQRSLILCLVLPLLAACNSVVAGSTTAANITHATFNDAVSHWQDVFTYTPPPPPQSPQTRYCYKMQSDVVCYDSPQSQQTAKLEGYQDGNQISWVQPGGGSLGASGGAPNAGNVRNEAQSAPSLASMSIDTSTPIGTSHGSSGIAVSDAPPPFATAKPSARH